jgi:hypothetical protein
MVFGFVKQSGGHVKIYSEEGHGTTVKLYLPRSTGQGHSAMAQLAIQVQGGDETILVVEDDALVRKYVTAQVASLGYETLEAANAAEALKIIENGAEVDLLFTDVIMPGVNERPSACDRDREGPAGPESAVHLRPYRKCHHPSRQAGFRCPAAR